MAGSGRDGAFDNDDGVVLQILSDLPRHGFDAAKIGLAVGLGRGADCDKEDIGVIEHLLRF